MGDLLNIMTEGMHLTSYFKKMRESVDYVKEMTTDATELKLPFKESATLNQILYVNEKHNKRELPKNEDKKNLHEIIKNNTIDLSEFERVLKAELNNLDLEWRYISVSKKRELLEDYCKKHDMHLTDTVIKSILKGGDKHVSYSRERREIEDISFAV